MHRTFLSKNGITVQAKFTSPDVEDTLALRCHDVVQRFELPSLRLFCYFATAPDEYDPHLQDQFGKYFRGLQVDSSGMNELPNYLKECFFHSDDEIEKLPGAITLQKLLCFDNLIYMRHSTCLDDTAFVTTLAHELQHFVQFGFSRKVWAANLILYWKVRDFGNHELTVVGIPYEREANLVSKGIAEAVCGAGTMRTFAEEQVNKYTALSKHSDDAALGELTKMGVF
jgi:hypothetical protein